ncbi:hypothetical protein D3C86_1627030 [compost metagenome]
MGKIAHPLQQAVRDTRRSARTHADLARSFTHNADLQNVGCAADDVAELIDGIKLQPADDTETVAQRRREQPDARRGADQGKWRQVKAHGACTRPLADDNIKGKVLHRWVQHLFHRSVEAVNLIDEEYIPLL